MVEASGSLDVSAVTKQKSAVTPKVQSEGSNNLEAPEVKKLDDGRTKSFKARMESESYTSQSEPVGVLKEFNKQMGMGSLLEGKA